MTSLTGCHEHPLGCPDPNHTIMKLYVAGPMTGLPQFNFPAFDNMAVILREMRYDVVSPAELDDEVDRAAALSSVDGAPGSGSHQGKTWGMFLARDVLLIADGGIEGIVCLDGWSRSRGARLETFVGFLCGIRSYKLIEGNLEPIPAMNMVMGWAGTMWDDVVASVKLRLINGLRAVGVVA